MLNIKNFHLLNNLSPEFSFLDMKYIIEVRYFIEYSNSFLFDEENQTNLHIIFLLQPKGAHDFYEISMNFMEWRILNYLQMVELYNYLYYKY